MKTLLQIIFLMSFVLSAFGQDNVLNFDGVDDKVNCGNVTQLNGASKVTIEMWVNMTEATTWGCFFSKRLNNDNRIAFHEGYEVVNGKIDLLVLVCNGTNTYGTANDVVWVNQWFHLAMVFDGTQSTNANRLKLYINGVLQSLVFTGTIPSTTPNLTDPVLLGDENMSTTVPFKGSLDEMRVWTTARTQTEIQQNMNKSMEGNESGLVMYYDFNQGTPGGNNSTETTLNDGTSNNYNGTLSDFSLNGTSSNWLARDITRPTSGATNITASATYSTEMNLQWTNGSGSGRAVFMKLAGTGTAAPADLTVYTPNAYLGSGSQIGSTEWFCVYTGTANNVKVIGLTASTQYRVMVCEYNGGTGTILYKTDAETNNPVNLSTNTTAAPNTTPTIQASDLYVTPADGGYNISWQNGNGSRRIVFMKNATTGTPAPVDNTQYLSDNIFGQGGQIGITGWYCVYNGTESSVTVKVSSNSTYRVMVCEYNGPEGAQKYMTTTAVNNPMNFTSTIVTVTATAGSPGPTWYNTLKEAFDKINDGTHQGAVSVRILSDVTETASAELLPSTSPANYDSVMIYPAISGVTVYGALSSSPLINLNGADNVIIDGRVNRIGAADLTLVNESHTSGGVIRLINDARNDTIRYCILKGDSYFSTTSGLVYISTAASGGTGNDYNCLENCILQGLGTHQNARPYNTIRLEGTSEATNDDNTIRNNHLSDVVRNYGIVVGTANNGTLISGNSISDSINILMGFSPVLINIQGENTTVTGNYLGGHGANCSGTYYLKSISTFQWVGIQISSGTTTDHLITNNSIRNIYLETTHTSSVSSATLIMQSSGIAAISNNMLGDSIGTGSIRLKTAYGNSSNGGTLRGIMIYGGKSRIESNTLGSLTTLTSNGAMNCNIACISASSGDSTSIINNLIGSRTTSSSIHASSVSNIQPQLIWGYLFGGAGAKVVTGNTMANLTNSGSYYSSILCTMSSQTGNTTLSGNRYYNISTSGTNGVLNAMDIRGTGLYNISSNHIYNLSNSNAGYESDIKGIMIYVATGTPTASRISRNFIHDLTLTSGNSAGKIFGIYDTIGVMTIDNNIISLGGTTNTRIYGIYECAGSTNSLNLYYNNVLISGSLFSGYNNKTYALYSSDATNTCDFRNNLFSNERSTVGGSNVHCAAGFNYGVSTGLTLDYNNYDAPATGGVLGYYNSTYLNSVPLVPGQDSHSINGSPIFVNGGGTNPEDYKIDAVLNGIAVPGVVNDFADSTRNTVSPNMGAWEYCTNPAYGGTIAANQSVCVGGTPATITSTALPSGYLGSLEYQWQSSEDGTTFNDITSASETNYSPGILTTSTWFRRLARVGCQPDWTAATSSDTVKITIFTLPVAVAPASGSGTAADPYLIATFANLQWISEDWNRWNHHYRQTANINASITASECYPSGDPGKGWMPIGNWSHLFTGHYDGAGYIIDSLTIKRPTETEVGLFGIASGGVIEHLGLTNADITGANYVGAIIGWALANDTIIRCHVSGKVHGSTSVGGLAGICSNGALVAYCYSEVSVTGVDYTGGFLGHNMITVPGQPLPSIHDCYSRGNVVFNNVQDWRIGGFIGENYNGNVERCYSTGSVTNLAATSPTSKGFIGQVLETGTKANNFWDTQTSLQSTSHPNDGATGKTSLQMKSIATFTSAGWDFSGETINGTENIWNIHSTINDGYPFFNWTSSVRYVDETRPDDSGDGYSWLTAKKTLQAALDNSVFNDQIWVAKGTYKPAKDQTGNASPADPRTRSFSMKEGVAIYGGFAGNEDASYDLSLRNFIANETILSGDHDGNDDFNPVNGGFQGTTGDENSYHVIYNEGSVIPISNAAILDGFTIKGGNANTDSIDNDGGGILNNNNCSPMLRNLKVINNAATYGGGIDCQNGSNPTVTSCIIEYNYATEGGGLYNDYSAPVYDRIEVRFNEAKYGGCLFNENQSAPTFINGRVHDNNAFLSGGGILNDGGSKTDMTNCLLYGNTAVSGAAFVSNYADTSTLTNCTLANNAASDAGGGVASVLSVITLNNCIVRFNQGNNAGNDLYLADAAEIILNYSSYSLNDVYNDNSTLTATNNCDTANPRFVDLLNDDLRLFGVSPAVNSGNNAYVQSPNPVIATDIRGENRISHTTVDMGAYEWKAGTDLADSARFYITEYNLGTVVEVNPVTGATTTRIGGLTYPSELAVSDSGYLFVAADWTNNEIRKFDVEGNPVGAQPFITAANPVVGMAIDPTTGFLAASGDLLQPYDPTTGNTAGTSFSTGIYGFDYDGQGILYGAINVGYQRIARYDAAGTLLGQIGIGQDIYDICVNGNYFFASVSGGIQKYDLSGSPVVNFGASGYLAMIQNRGIEVIGNTLYVCKGNDISTYNATTGELLNTSFATGFNYNLMSEVFYDKRTPIPVAPVATAATSLLVDGFTANWNPGKYALYYHLDVATDSTFTSMVSGYSDLDVGSVTSYAVTGLAVNDTFYYRVRAWNPFGLTSNSNVIKVIVTPAHFLVNGVYYDTWNNAMSEGISGGYEVKQILDYSMTESSTVTGNVTLDLNSCTFSGTGSITIMANKMFSLTDKSAGKNGTMNLPVKFGAGGSVLSFLYDINLGAGFTTLGSFVSGAVHIGDGTSFTNYTLSSSDATWLQFVQDVTVMSNSLLHLQNDNILSTREVKIDDGATTTLGAGDYTVKISSTDYTDPFSGILNIGYTSVVTDTLSGDFSQFYGGIELTNGSTLYLNMADNSQNPFLTSVSGSSATSRLIKTGGDYTIGNTASGQSITLSPYSLLDLGDNSNTGILTVNGNIMIPQYNDPNVGKIRFKLNEKGGVVNVNELVCISGTVLTDETNGTLDVSKHIVLDMNNIIGNPGTSYELTLITATYPISLTGTVIPVNVAEGWKNIAVTLKSGKFTFSEVIFTGTYDPCTDPTDGGGIAASQSICYNTAPDPFTNASLPSGETGTLEYQWQSSTDSVNFADITSATQTGYTSGNLTTTTWFRRLARVDCMPDWNGAAISDTIKVTVYPSFTVGSIGSDETLCYNTTPALLTSTPPTGGTAPYSYQWQSSTDGTNFSDIGSATETTYQPDPLTESTWYRLIQTSAESCGTDTTNTVKVTIYDAFAVGSISSAQTICYNADPEELTGTDPTGGNTPYTYRWQSSTDNSTFNDIPGATSLNFDPTSLNLTTYYRQIQTSASSCGTDTTNTVTITVYDEFVVGSISEAQTICYNTTPSQLTSVAPTGGNTPYTYRWQHSTDNSTFTDIGSASETKYQPGVLTQSTWYRLIQTSASSCGTDTTNTVKVTVYDAFVVGSISSAQTICYNADPEELTGTDPTGGNTPYTYRWQSSTDNSTFNDIPGATSLNFDPTSLNLTTYYRQIQTSASSCGTDTTNTVTITVYDEFVVGSISADQSICFNETPDELTSIAPAGGNTPYTYQWQSTTESIYDGPAYGATPAGFQDIPGATDVTYQPDALTQTTHYRLKQTSASSCGTLITDTVTITVFPLTEGGAVSGGTQVCYGTNSTLLTLSGHTGSVAKWQNSTDGTSWNDIPGTTGTTYTAVNLTEDTWYRAVVQSGVCSNVPSDSTRITIITGMSISGYARYYNNPLTPLNGLKILLKEGSNAIDSVNTDMAGHYAFDGLDNGTYSLTVKSAHPSGQWQTWAGVTNSDYMLVSQHIAGTNLLQVDPPVVRVSASTKVPHPLINNVDANAIRQAAKFPSIGWSYFDIPKWVFSGTTTATGLDNIVVVCSDVTRDIRGLCGGDVNGTYVPGSGNKDAGAGLELLTRGTIPVLDEMTFAVRIDRQMELGAITLFMNYDPKQIEILNVTMPENAGNDPWFETNNGVLYIGWISTEPVSVVENQTVMLVHARLLTPVETHGSASLQPTTTPIRFTLNETMVSELADGSGHVIDGAKLVMPGAGSNGETVKRQNGKVVCYPNPVQSTLNIELFTSNLQPSTCNLELVNLHGVTVLNLQPATFSNGWHKVRIDVRDLMPGAYCLRAWINGELFVKKVIINR